MPIESWSRGLRLIIEDGLYWEEPVKASVVVNKLEVDGSTKILKADLRGTQSESLVRWKGLHPKAFLDVDLCVEDCPKTSKDGLVHCTKVRKWTPEVEEGWMTVLEEVGNKKEDELARLRERSDALRLEEEDARPKEARSSSSHSRKKSKEEKKRKKQKREKKKEENPKKRVTGAKDPQEVFGGTGLDPDYQVRKKMLRRAKKVAKRKERKSSSTGSSSSEESTSSGEPLGSGLFGQEARVKSVWVRTPGTLTCSTLEQMQNSLVQQSGQPWNVEKGPLPPLFSQYWRLVLDSKASRPMSREMQTLSYVQDLMLQGRIASAADVVTQRLKSLEQTASGGDYRVSLRQELVPLDMSSMSSTKETMEASRLQREELKARSAASRPWDRGQKGDIPYWDKGKGKKGENLKGKKGNGKKGDGKKGGKDDHTKKEEERK